MGVFRVPIEISYTDAGGPGVNVWSVRTIGPSSIDDQAQLDAAVNEIHGFYQYLRDNGVAPSNVWANGTTFKMGVIVHRETGEEWNSPWVNIVCSTGTGDLPPHLAGCVAWRTSLRARRGMGRTFLGPLNAGCLSTDGTPVDTFVTHVNTAVANLIEASDSATSWAVGVWGQQNRLPGASSEDRRLAAHVHRDSVSGLMKDRFAVMRSRRD